jgi:hypothetical protein
VFVLTLGDVVLVATGLPPDEAVYHRTVVPFAPGVAVIVPDPQTSVIGVEGLAGMGLTVIVKGVLVVLTQPVVVLKLPAQNVVVELADGDVVPVPSTVGLDELEYHFIDVAFDPGVAVTVPGPQTVTLEPDGAPGFVPAVNTVDPLMLTLQDVLVNVPTAV